MDCEVKAKINGTILPVTQFFFFSFKCWSQSLPLKNVIFVYHLELMYEISNGSRLNNDKNTFILQ